MTEDTKAIKQRHERFVKTICESEIVIGLKSKDGFATSTSDQYEDENGKPVELICFWSDNELAKSCIKEDWESYKPEKINLEEFMENWCVGMHNDGIPTGTNFDENLLGYEIEPLELLLEIVTVLRRINKNIEFNNFKGYDDIEEQVRKIMN